MGMLTTFFLCDSGLIDDPDFHIAFDYFWHQNGSPKDYGLPVNYKVRSVGIDKSWNGWHSVLNVAGLDQLADMLFDWTEELRCKDDVWLRVLRYDPINEIDNVPMALSFCPHFDPDTTVTLGLEHQIQGYDGDPLSRAEIEYVASHIKSFLDWFAENYEPEDALLIAIQ